MASGLSFVSTMLLCKGSAEHHQFMCPKRAQATPLNRHASLQARPNFTRRQFRKAQFIDHILFGQPFTLQTQLSFPAPRFKEYVTSFRLGLLTAFMLILNLKPTQTLAMNVDGCGIHQCTESRGMFAQQGMGILRYIHTLYAPTEPNRAQACRSWQPPEHASAIAIPIYKASLVCTPCSWSANWFS